MTLTVNVAGNRRFTVLSTTSRTRGGRRWDSRVMASQISSGAQARMSSVTRLHNEKSAQRTWTAMSLRTACGENWAHTVLSHVNWRH